MPSVLDDAEAGVGNLEEWCRVGRELCAADRVRFHQLLLIAKRVVAAHDDPLRTAASGPSFMPPPSSSDSS